MLLELPEVVALLNELRREIEATDQSTLYPTYLYRVNSVAEWKFSAGDYFAPVPFESERMGFSSEVLVKKNYKSLDEARWMGSYCAGFISGKHVVTVRPSEQTVDALLATLYDDSGAVLIVRSVSFRGLCGAEKRRSQLTGLGRLISRPDNTKLSVAVGIHGAFSINLYRYSEDGRPVSATAFSKGWPSEDEIRYHYTPEGRLDEITAGGAVPLWKRK